MSGCWPLYLVKNEKSSSFTEYSEGLAALRQVVAEPSAGIPRRGSGSTGIPIMENDEMESSQTAMAQAGVFSFVGVALLYIAGFGSVRHPTMALAALLVPMGWAFGYILAHGRAPQHPQQRVRHDRHRLGQRLRRLLHRPIPATCGRRRCRPSRPCWKRPAPSVPDLTTSAVATALAFFTIGLSDFPGIAELGIIAGGGILLCWLAALTTLPALIHWSDAQRGPWPVPAPLDVYAWFRPLANRPRWS